MLINRCLLAIILSLSTSLSWADSTFDADTPTMAASIQTAGAACSNIGEPAITSAGDALSCTAGGWSLGYPGFKNTYRVNKNIAGMYVWGWSETY